MAEKTIKVDEAVHRRLDELKIKHGVETFNEVLRHELDIVPAPDVDQLGAYLDVEVKQTVKQIIDDIRELGEFKETVTESRRAESLEFISPESNMLIASIEFTETSFCVKYRGQDGELNDCGRGSCSSSGDPRYGLHSTTSTSTEPQSVINKANDKIAGSYKRWVS